MVFFQATSDNEYSCRVWSLNKTPIHKALVLSTDCTNETLQVCWQVFLLLIVIFLSSFFLQKQISSNFNSNFDSLGLSPPAEAFCCNWTYCNYNTTFAQMASNPNSAMSFNFVINIVLLNLFAFIAFSL